MRSLFKLQNCISKLIKRLQTQVKVIIIYFIRLFRILRHNRSAKIIFKLLLVMSCILGWLFLVKLPRERKIRSAEVTENIKQILGTRLTAVTLKPEENTTRLQPSITCHEDIFGIILIKSTPENYLRRKMIRNTWMQDIPKISVVVKAFFFVGVSGEKNITKELNNEAMEHNDIIIEDLTENYYLLALKTLRMLKWFSKNCPEAKYFIKTDDDILLNIQNMVNHIQSVPQQSWVNYIGGQLRVSDPVDKNPYSKWFSPEDWWTEDSYPPFVTGALTVIGSDVISLLLKTSLTVPLFHLEDVYLVGMIAFDKLHIVPQNIPRIEANSPEWIIMAKMVFSSTDLATTGIAFHVPNNLDFMETLYKLKKIE